MGSRKPRVVETAYTLSELSASTLTSGLKHYMGVVCVADMQARMCGILHVYGGLLLHALSRDPLNTLVRGLRT
jgi:hypothetical protein